MAAIDISSVSAPLNTGVLQLQNGVAMDSTLRNVADQLNTTSPLKLSTAGVKVESTLQITTNSNPYIDAEDGAGNNRFQVGRDPSSQVVNIDFASNPTGGTNMVGGIRTYTDGVNLAQVMSFRKDGAVGINTTSPTQSLEVSSNAAVTTLLISNNIGAGTGNSKARLFFSQADSYTSYIEQGVGSLNILTHAGSSPVNITGTLAVGSISGAKLGIKGTGSTSATTSLLVQNSSGTTSLQVTDDRTTFVNGLLNVGTIYTGLDFNGAVCNIFNNGGSGGQIRLSMGGTTYFNVYQAKDASSGVTSGTINTITTPIGYGWSSGSASPNLLSLNPSINNTGTYSGTFRGIYYNPTLTSLTGTTHYGIQTTSGGAYINTTTPQASACLQADSTTQGFLPPRMTDAEIRAIVAPANGLVAYNTDINHLCCYQGGAWVKFSHSPM